MSEFASVPHIERPIAEGLRLIASNPASPGVAYRNLMLWGKERGLFGFDNMAYSWIPRWDDSWYISTTITSDGATRDPGTPLSQAIERNVRLAEALTTQLILDHNIAPRNVVLSTDLPKVPGWKQSDFMILWLSLLEGVPGELAEGIGLELQRFAAQTRMDDSSASYDERWDGYQALVGRFWDIGDQLYLHRRNDWREQHASVRNMVQLVGATRALGCRAEDDFARRKRINLYKIDVREELLPFDVAREVGNFAALGAAVGQPPQAVRLIPS